MSSDESIVLIASLAVAGLCWGSWNWQLVAVHPLLCGPGYRMVLGMLPVVCAALLFFILKGWSAVDVRDDARYLFLYQVLGAAWVLGAALALPWFGYCLRDDVLERRNAAAAWVICGALVALTLAYGGGNIGNGPGWWVVVFSAGLATATLFGLWLALELTARLARAITCDRDLSAGLRLAGLLVAVGLILARAVAGDWISALATVRDFVLQGWPVLPLVVVAGIVEQLAPRGQNAIARPLGWGILPAALYLGGAAAWLSLLGPAA